MGGSAGGWLALWTEKPGVFAGLTNGYILSIRALFTGEDRRIDAARALFADLRRNAARLTVYPVAETAELAVALRGAGWWVKETPAGDRHWLDLGDMDHDSWWASRPGALRNTVQRKAKKEIGRASCRERVCQYV